MTKKEPKATKSLKFLDDRDNAYLVPIGGGLAFIFCSAEFPDKTWDGFIFNKNSHKMVEGMIESLQWIQRNYLK